jgi:hypothetical protein
MLSGVLLVQYVLTFYDTLTVLVGTAEEDGNYFLGVNMLLVSFKV